ncbi:MAG: sn-glycerol-3-phosphate ABC transporter ATP-binding protein UgpC [Clostridiales Family XIII bacterium]|jgi:multiple sugar transport system ATP-binding protein|nr:sn-glycerol-3-phosphate ABC transporter ATP-binding protein UgpC [Clostridiales Family XIII bacterium]
MAQIALNNVSKVYKGGTTAVDNLNLEIEDGAFIVLVGPSGCGKTTVLRMVAGLEDITSGTIRIGDRVVNNIDPGDRDIAMVFQNYALYPHMTVFDNIAFPLQCKKVPKAEIRERVNRAATLLGLSEYLPRKPRTLSGGQRQRVAMGRALVREARAFLMDEPLSNLDAKLRVQMRSEISALQKNLGVTTIYVTHDQVEAMTMGTKIAVMRLGVLQQYGTPQEVYSTPANIFVASFIGSPSMNFMKAHVLRDGDRHRLAIGDRSLDIPEEAIRKRPGLTAYVNSDIVFGIRPEHLEIGAPTDRSSLEARVTQVEMLGAEQLVHVAADFKPITVDEVLGAVESNQAVSEQRESGRTGGRADLVVCADSDLAVSPSDTVKLSARPGCMHFFAPDGGKSIID